MIVIVLILTLMIVTLDAIDTDNVERPSELRGAPLGRAPSERERVADAVARLELGRGAVRGQAAGGHDGDVVRQQVRLLHAVRRQHDRAA